MRFCILLLLALPLSAAERTHTVVPEDYFSLARITEVAVSPDGKWVAFAESRWSKDDDLMKGDLWVIATDGKSKPVRLTFDRANDRHLKWSADSKTIYFLGNRKREAEKKAPYDGKTQAWCIPATGGEPRAITRVDGGIDHYDLAPAANALFYSTEKTHHDSDDFEKLRSKYKLDYGGGVRKISEIHRINLDDWRTEKVYDEKRYVREFAATRDGKRLAMVTAFDDTVVKSEGESRVDIMTDPGPGNVAITTPPMDSYRFVHESWNDRTENKSIMKQKAENPPSPNAWLENLTWNPEGTYFAFHAIFDGYPAYVVKGKAESRGWHMYTASNEKYHVNGYGRGSGPPLILDKSGRHMQLIEKDARSSIGALIMPPYLPSEANKKEHVYGFAFNEANNLCARITCLENEMSSLVKSKTTESGDQIYDPNPHTSNWKLPTVKHIIWKAPDGADVGGVLELPLGYDGKSKLPLVVAIHGGPTTSSKAALEFDPHNGRLYFSAAGYAVLCPNYRGSTGYGDKFVTDLIGRENDIEVNDIITGVEHLVKEGIADPERVGVMGWSNGGYLTNCLITRKDLPFKLKAASSGAGIVDTVAEWGFNDEPAYPRVFKKGHPWETPDLYKKTSPTYDLANIKTPTLIHVGGNDVRCPPGHSRMLHRALKEYLNVPTELCEYPGEPHGLSKMTHRRAKMEWDLAWFDKYLKGK